MSEQTATERLRALLDERGVKWQTGVLVSRPEDEVTIWPVDRRAVRADEYKDGRLLVEMNLTPEQAIAATLGNDGVGRTNDGVAERGTCEVDCTVKWDWDRCGPYWEHELSCGHTATTMEPEPPNFCPNCGAEVVE